MLFRSIAAVHGAAIGGGFALTSACDVILATPEAFFSIPETRLGMAPSPGVFLAAAAARTTRIKLGPLIYIVPAYSPLRLIEEICMLDHLSKGRYQFGMGRGISPFETAYHGIRADESHAMYREAVDIVLKGLTQERLSHSGKYWNYSDVPMVLRP